MDRRMVPSSHTQPDWSPRPARKLQCPTCGTVGSKPFVLSIRSGWINSEALDLYACPSCESKFFPDLEPPEYENFQDAEAYLKFYLEVGAGVDQLIRHLFAVPLDPKTRYLEIGCGFGFSVDFAQRALGFASLGVDPSPFAAAGASLLGVPIVPEYLVSGAGFGVEKFHLAVASEVIEHIFEARSFVGSIKEHLTDDGVLILTTPNAAGVVPGTSPGNLAPLLSAGWHYILYGEKGLRKLLRDAGFRRVEIIARGYTLVAAATNADTIIDLKADVDRNLYRRYLEDRRKTVDPGSNLAHGYGYRLLKELTNTAAYKHALELYEEMRREFALRYGFDLETEWDSWLLDKDPNSFPAFASRYPMCLCGVAHLRGLVALNYEVAPERAVHYFSLSERYGGLLRRHLQRLGADDAETELFAARSRILQLRALAYKSPNVAAEHISALLSALRVTAEQYVGQRKELVLLFAHLVHLGALDAAQRLISEAEAFVDGRDGGPDLGTENFKFEMQFAFGRFQLSEGRNPRQAVLRFALAERAARWALGTSRAVEQVWRARRERLFAWLVVGRVERAMLVGRLWHNPGARYRTSRDDLLNLFLGDLMTETGPATDWEPKRLLAARLLAYAFPREAAEILRSRGGRHGARMNLSMPEQKELAAAFVHLVNFGMLEPAEALARECESLLNTKTASRSLSDRFCFEARRGLGLFELNRQQRPRAAALHFALAERCGRRWLPSEPARARAVWQTRHDRILAWLVAGNAQRAMQVARPFANAGKWPSIPGDVAASVQRLVNEASQPLQP